MINQIEPWIDKEELRELQRVIESTFVTEHDLTSEFEEMMKELTGAKHAVAISNGTAGLYCCLRALNIGQDDEVIVPDMTFIATSNAVMMANAKPVFCEIDEGTFCIDMDKADDLITEKTKAIIPVHLYGQSADMDKVAAFAEANDLKVIEDAAQGVGVTFKSKHVGTMGELGVQSFYGNKTITTGEGGMILTDDEELAKTCYRLKNHGRDTKGTFVHERIGFNFSFTEMQAAVGIAQLKKLPKIIDKKNEIHQKYIDELDHLESFKPVFIDDRCSPVYWFTSFLCDEVEELMDYLLVNKIQTRRFFYPLHMQPCYKGVVDTNTSFGITEKIYDTGISLPSSYGLTASDQALVISKIKEFYDHRD